MHPPLLKKESFMRFRRLRELRLKNELTQRDVADILNCTQSCYSQYERGLRDIPTSVLIALADFYRTSADYLLGRTSQ